MNPSVLVVEDDPTLNRLLVKELRKAGYELDSASSWQEARERIAAFAPNLVLLDVNLPDATGFGPLSEIAGTRPVVMLTAYGSVHQAVEAMRLGAADYLVKPVEASAILAALFKRDLAARAVPSSERMPLEALERAHISQVLAENDGNISRTAEILKMHRRTLQRKLSKFQPASRGNEAGAKDVRRSGCTGEMPGPA